MASEVRTELFDRERGTNGRESAWVHGDSVYVRITLADDARCSEAGLSWRIDEHPNDLPPRGALWRLRMDPDRRRDWEPGFSTMEKAALLLAVDAAHAAMVDRRDEILARHGLRVADELQPLAKPQAEIDRVAAILRHNDGMEYGRGGAINITGSPYVWTAEGVAALRERIAKGD